MATVQMRVPPGEVPPDLQKAKDDLEAAGHTVELVRDEDQEKQHDPFAGMKIEEIPESMLKAMGITREELRRHRNAAPAIEHTGRSAAAQPAVAPAPAPESTPTPSTW